METEKARLYSNEPVAQQLPAPATAPASAQTHKRNNVVFKLSIALILFGFFLLNTGKAANSFPGCLMTKHSQLHLDSPHHGDDSLCPISKKIIPKDFENFKAALNVILHDTEFRDNSASKLGNAVKIATEIQDGWKDIDSDNFKPFIQFHEYLAKTFPKVHSTLKLDKVNIHGLVYTWEGTNSTLKPLLLTAHQDVVPVDWSSEDRWTYYPFSGHYDGEKVWGRGASDCKNLLIGLLESVELLLEHDFQPKRTVVLGFGYDEEASGLLGASKISEFLEDKYGPNSLYAIIDEGNSGITKFDDRYIVPVATGEKGYVDNLITLNTAGGHSSVPPDHTSIGLLSQVIAEVESTPFDPLFTNVNPTFGFLQCYASHSSTIDDELKKNILRAGIDRNANQKIVDYLSKNKGFKYLIGTSQAVDIIYGGVKANALPESATALINTRISVESSVKEVVDKLTGNILKIAEANDLGVIVDGKEVRKASDAKNGYFNYTLIDALSVAPVTPWSGDVWDVFSGTLRHFYEDVARSVDNELIVAPSISTGNTDTKSYWRLTNNIYRYEPGSVTSADDEGLGNGIHSVDEFVEIDDHLKIIAFYYEYLRTINSVADFDHE